MTQWWSHQPGNAWLGMLLANDILYVAPQFKGSVAVVVAQTAVTLDN